MSFPNIPNDLRSASRTIQNGFPVAVSFLCCQPSRVQPDTAAPSFVPSQPTRAVNLSSCAFSVFVASEIALALLLSAASTAAAALFADAVAAALSDAISAAAKPDSAARPPKKTSDAQHYRPSNRGSK